GFDELLKDTPRSVFQVSKAQLATDNIRNFSDLSRYSPSIRRGTATPYGIAGIRGSLADYARNGTILINTALRAFNNNAWESADILAGAPSVSQGSTAKVAGYVNYITKKPYFDGPHTTITAFAGRLGEKAYTSYPQYTVTLDHSLVLIKDKLAARVSLQRSEAEQYWDGTQADFKDIYAALTWQPSKRLTVEVNLSYTRSQGALPWGINRVDQTLINDWTYRAGDYVPRAAFGGTNYTFNPALNGGLGGWFTGSNASTSVYALGTAPWETWHDADGNGVQDKAYVATLSFVAPQGGLVREPITGNQVIAGQRGANNIGSQFILQGVTTFRANDWLTVINRTSYQNVENTNNNYDNMYSEHPNRVFETRVEFITDKEFKLFGKLPIRWQSNTGPSYRYLLNNCDSAVDTNYSNILNTYANALNPATIDVSYALSSYLFQMTQGNVINNHPTHVGGTDWTDGTPWVDSTNALKGILKSGYGYFWVEPDWEDGGTQRGLSIGGGNALGYGRADAYSYSDRRNNYLHYMNLFTEQKFDIGKWWTIRLDGRYSYIYDTIKHTKLTQRLFKEGYFAGSPYANAPRSSHAENHQWQYGGSISFHPFRWLNLYALYDHTEIINGCTCCEAGGWSTGYRLAEGSLSVPNRIHEYGAKFDIIPGKLFASAAYYNQTRGSASTNWTTGTVSYTETVYEGLEGSVTWQPTSRSSVGANYSYVQAGGRPSGSTKWKNFNQSQENGTPLNTYNLWVSYQFQSGVGVKGDLWLTSKWKVSGSVRVPEQNNINLGVFYAAKGWRVDVDIMNVTDEKNWGPANNNSGDTFGYLLPLERRGLQAKITRSF
ncbi:MAG: TonB-dependent receptor plug domain-containing protein, partial [Opitutaceae bacterium]|nr:TonB-dependent receptor plug domain-containing protein [Opitutaceae bacterium]